MPKDRTLVAIPCNLSPGSFSGERVFEIRLANGESYTSLAPRQFCWTADGKLVGERELTTKTAGMIAARIVVEIEDNQLQIEVPDGEVIAVDRSLIKPRPTSIVPPSSVLRVPTGQ